MSQNLNANEISGMRTFYGRIVILHYTVASKRVVILYLPRNVINNVFLNSTTLIITAIIFASLEQESVDHTALAVISTVVNGKLGKFSRVWKLLEPNFFGERQ